MSPDDLLQSAIDRSWARVLKEVPVLAKLDTHELKGILRRVYGIGYTHGVNDGLVVAGAALESGKAR